MTIRASCFVPVPALVEANKKRGEHWAKKKARKDERVEHTLAVLHSHLGLTTRVSLCDEIRLESVLVRLISISVQKPDDDNLAGALKHYRDAVAFWLGIPDDDQRVTYVCKWERYKGKGKRGVRIEFVRFIDHLREERERIAAQIATLTGGEVSQFRLGDHVRIRADADPPFPLSRHNKTGRIVELGEVYAVVRMDETGEQAGLLQRWLAPADSPHKQPDPGKPR